MYVFMYVCDDVSSTTATVSYEAKVERVFPSYVGPTFSLDATINLWSPLFHYHFFFFILFFSISQNTQRFISLSNTNTICHQIKPSLSLSNIFSINILFYFFFFKKKNILFLLLQDKKNIDILVPWKI